MSARFRNFTRQTRHAPSEKEVLAVISTLYPEIPIKRSLKEPLLVLLFREMKEAKFSVWFKEQRPTLGDYSEYTDNGSNNSPAWNIVRLVNRIWKDKKPTNKAFFAKYREALRGIYGDEASFWLDMADEDSFKYYPDVWAFRSPFIRELNKKAQA